MGQKDLTEKILEDYDDVFADIINGLIFKGEQRVKPSDLRAEGVHSQYKADDNKLHEQERDVVKDWVKSNVRIAICGIENQTKPEKNMVARVFGYEGASYRSQLLKDKNAKIVPVVTIVLYFGTENHWNQPTNLKDVLNIPEGMDDYINDFNINVFEIAWLTDEEISRFKSDFKVVANFFVNKRRNKDYVPNDTTEFDHVDEILKLLSAMTGDNRYEEILAMPGKDEVRNMCNVAERLENKGRAEGLVEGRAEGRAEGKLEQLIELVKDNLLSVANAAQKAEMPETDFLKLLENYKNK